MEPLYVPAGHMSAHQAAATLRTDLAGIRCPVRHGRLARAGGSPRQPYYDSEQVLAPPAEHKAA
ncbi:hypothetical protein [Streptomyces sp. NPDC020983]|uniref:hypothetical protein n=1 Tax=Streptomyces sp. NPDC020983 TaxID=3365106 RepID=UPI0037975507